MLRKALLASLAPLLVSAADPPRQQCEAPLPVPPSVTAPHSTYYDNDEPPARFAHPPGTPIKMRFGQAAINELCGRPPCGMKFLACTDGDVMAMPDPYTTSPVEFEHLMRHELAHVNGWPDTHGD